MRIFVVVFSRPNFWRDARCYAGEVAVQHDITDDKDTHILHLVVQEANQFFFQLLVHNQ